MRRSWSRCRQSSNLPLVRAQFSLDQRLAAAGTLVIVIPVATAIAMFRYQLWDVDVFLRRSALYAALSVAIGAVYVGVTASLGVAAGNQLALWIAAVTTAAATLALQPARRWLTTIMLRRLGGQRPDGQDLLHKVGKRWNTRPSLHEPCRLAACRVVMINTGEPCQSYDLHGRDAHHLSASRVIWCPPTRWLGLAGRPLPVVQP